MTDANTTKNPIFEPETEANQRLRKDVAPPDWVNPEAAEKYNLVVIGAGSGGLVTAAGAAGLGARVALIERDALGGDCLNVGCVPSKALLSAAKRAAAVRDASGYGVSLPGGSEVDFSAVMERMRELRASIGPNDSAERFKELGIDVFLGEGRFKNEATIEVDGKELKFAKAVIATGGRAIVLPIPGLKEAGALTNETLFSLTELPRRFAVIGAGPIGCEMAQAFARLGSEVTLFEAQCKILPREDADAAKVVEAALERDGVRTVCDAKIEQVGREGDLRTIRIEHEGATQTWEFDQILVGVGRAPNVEGIGLENADVEFDKRKGVSVDAQLRTSNPKIFAVGDVAMDYKFTHMADATARIVIQNALFKGRKKHTDLLVPWCTYTQPEIAHVGLYEQEAKAQHGDALQTFRQDFSEIDRSILEGDTEGFVKMHTVKGKIVGATIVGEHAGDLISEITVAMQGGVKLGALSAVIHPYPTTAEAIQRIGDAYNKTRFTPLVAKLFKTWLKWTCL
ncbi:MAG: FAD-containing oxidoreductase [Verrucomicrobia bacterium]|jgi:pyruvate/2-oxoglutarate dehydrogenase complex dihydrolipoamide dehydrogenase (E3) component|nr:FAD-containing oxidoreductase [Verrucomicrobiota bacterium]